MEEEIKADEKNIIARAAVQTTGRLRVNKLWAFTFFCGMYLPSVSPVFAPKFSSQNIYTEKSPISPRAPSDLSAHGGSLSGNRMSEGHWAPSPEYENREQSQYWCTFIKLCTLAGINGVALWLGCNRILMPTLARPHWWGLCKMLMSPPLPPTCFLLLFSLLTFYSSF